MSKALMILLSAATLMAEWAPLTILRLTTGAMLGWFETSSNDTSGGLATPRANESFRRRMR